MYRKNLSALIGLVGAVGNNGKTEKTDVIVRQALLHITDELWGELIREEKFRISPSCEICKTPCGNTSDYPMDKFETWSDDQKKLKEQLVRELKRIAANGDSALPEIVYRAISYIGYDLEDGTYQRLLEEMNKW